MNWKITRNNIPALKQQLHTNAVILVRTTRNNIKQSAADGCPVLTGYMKSTIADEEIDDLHGVVGVGAEYAPFVNFGAHGRRPNPFFSSAGDNEQSDFIAGGSRLVTG